MKHYGNNFEYEEQRNKELLQAFRTQIMQCDHINLNEVCEKVVNMPASRFWVSEKRASIVVLSILKGDKLQGMSSNKREMFYEIYRRVKALKKKMPEESIYRLASIAVNQPAPKFYLTPKSANVIINKIKRKWYEERKKKLRHTY